MVGIISFIKYFREINDALITDPATLARQTLLKSVKNGLAETLITSCYKELSIH